MQPFGSIHATKPCTALLLAACAGHNTATDRQARYSEMVGCSEAELIQRLGLPIRRESVDGHEFLIYEQSDVWPLHGAGASSGLMGLSRHSFGAAVFDCRATFVVVEDMVSAYSLRQWLLIPDALDLVAHINMSAVVLASSRKRTAPIMSRMIVVQGGCAACSRAVFVAGLLRGAASRRLPAGHWSE